MSDAPSWWNEHAPWLIGVGALGGPAMTVLMFVLKDRSKRRDDDRSDEQKAIDRQESLDQKLRAMLSADQAAQFDRYKAEIVELRARDVARETERQHLEDDRLRGWNYARAWFARAHELRHLYNGLAGAVDRMSPSPAVLSQPLAPLPPLEMIDDRRQTENMAFAAGQNRRADDRKP